MSVNREGICNSLTVSRTLFILHSEAERNKKINMLLTGGDFKLDNTSTKPFFYNIVWVQQNKKMWKFGTQDFYLVELYMEALILEQQQAGSDGGF